MKTPKMQKPAGKPQQHHFSEKVTYTMSKPGHYAAPKTTKSTGKPKQHC